MNDIIRTKRLRAFIGWLGMLLPWIVVLLQLFNETFRWPASISATWHTNACTPFMIILGSAGILLMCYHGYDKVDDIINTLAGVFGIGICIFPCRLKSMTHDEHIGTFLIHNEISDIIHLISAILFFGLLAYNSFFQFTKGSGEPTHNKKIRNIIYHICGVGMIGSFAIVLIPNFSIKVWLMETVALFFFGISWLTKANKYKFLFKD
jgi:hypothetical protein